MKLIKACTAIVLALVGFVLSVSAQAQYAYTTNNGTITITKYTGSGGAVTIPSEIDGLSVTVIGSQTFQGCTSLTSITIPNSVTIIGNWAFSGCTRLSAITVDALNSFYSSMDGVLFNKSQTTIIQYPMGRAGSYTIPNGVTSFGYSAFSGCTSLTRITIPNSITSIEAGAFQVCTSLTSVTIPDSVTSIGSWAFSGCTGLTSVTIGNSVTTIGRSAFSGCSGLNSVTIPNSVTSIGFYAFSGCYNLGNVTIPDSVTSIGDGAFSGCTSLSAITVDALNSFYSSMDGVLFDKSQTTLIQYLGSKAGGYTIPDSVTSIGDGAFQSCTSLTNITIPNSVTSIGDWAFGECTSLTSVTIPDSVTNIAYSAFSGCTGLTNVTIPDSLLTVVSIGFETTGLGLQGLGQSLGTNGFRAIKVNESIMITGYNCSNNVVTIPDTINGLPVTMRAITINDGESNGLN